MKIRFIKSCEVDMSVGSDPEGEPVFETRGFEVGEEHYVDVASFATTFSKGGNGTSPNKDWPLFEFENGNVSSAISTELFEIIEGQDEFDQEFADALSEDAVDDAIVDAKAEEEYGISQDLER